MDRIRGRWVQGWRWCPTTQAIERYDERGAMCTRCDSPEEHHKLVSAKWAERAWDDNDALRRRLNVCDRAEIGEPEALAADMLAAYHRAAGEREGMETITRLVEGLARVGVFAIGNARWAHAERDRAERLAMALREALDVAQVPQDDGGEVTAADVLYESLLAHKDWAWEQAIAAKAKLDGEPISHGQENVGWPPGESPAELEAEAASTP